MKLLIINDGSDYSNWGIQACIDGLSSHFIKFFNKVDTVKHILIHQIFEWDIRVFGKKLFSENNRVMFKFSPVSILIPRVYDDFDEVAKKWQNGEGGKNSIKIISKIKECDVVVFNAEGSTYRNNIGAIAGLFILWYSKKYFNKKSFFINGSVTISSEVPRMPTMIKKCYEMIDGFAVREPYSYQELKDYLKSDFKLQFFPDSAFNVSLDKNQVNKSLKDRVNNFGEFVCFSRSMIRENPSAIGYLIKRLLDKGFKIIFFAKDDTDQFIKQYDKGSNTIFLNDKYNYHDIMFVLSKSKALISGRYHHLIFSLKQGTPVVMLNTSSHKIIGLNNMYKDFFSRVFDPGNLYNETEFIIDELKRVIKSNERTEILRLSENYNNEFNKMGPWLLKNKKI
jgi:polysaccharide pyruvyl transferase WcaK-like protein